MPVVATIPLATNALACGSGRQRHFGGGVADINPGY
jgi:hypothetical protein